MIRDQRKTLMVAGVMMVASFWVFGQLDRWQLAGCVAGGVFLGLLNHLYTEYWLLKIIESGAQPTRNQMIAATISRLTVLTVGRRRRRRPLLARRHRPAARPRRVPPDRPGDDRAAPAEGVEEPVIRQLTRSRPPRRRATATIEIGHHVEREFLGMTFNIDTIWATLIAGTIVVLLGFWARAKLTKDTDDHVPTKIQLIWEAVIGGSPSRSRTTSARSTAPSSRSRWRCSSSS